MTKVFVFDTYAVIEILRGNKNYNQYLNSKLIINDFIFAELSYNLIKEKGLEKSSRIIDKYSQFILKVSTKIIKDAMQFRFENRKKDISMTDCISYLQAKDLSVKFLTGDKEFEGLPNVEFIR